MKKNFIFALMSAIALTGVTGLTACSDKEELAEIIPSPGYDAKTGEVTTDFVFNVSMGTNQTTRMSSYYTQADAVNSTGLDATSTKWFRGIDNAKLFSYKLKKNTGTTASPIWNVVDGLHVYEARDNDGSHDCKFYDLGVAITENGLAPAGTGTTKSRRVLELALPTETNTLMFYGKAIRSGTGTNFDQGSVTMSISEDGDISKHLISLNKIVTDAKKNSLIEYENLIQAALSKIVQTSVELPAQSMDGRTWAGGIIKWSDYVTTTVGSDGLTITNIDVKAKYPIACTGESANDMSGLSEILAQAYKTFNTIYDVGGHSELRAGSGPDIRRMVKDLYNIVKSVADATPTNVEGMVAKNLAIQINQNIAKVFETSEAFPWQPISVIQTFTGFTDAQISSISDKTTKLTDFPKTEFGLPYGAVILKFLYNSSKGEGEYKYMSSVPTYAMGTGAAFNPFNYTYPAELCYYGNSPIYVTDNEKAISDYPDGTTDWTNSSNTKWSDWTKNSHVLSSTRAVAMKDCINYGTALLKTTIKYGTGVLYDNNAQIQQERTGATESDNAIKVNTADGATSPFVLTGILVGGQPGSVNWCYIPTGASGAAPDFAYMIYDNAIVGGGAISVPATATDEGATSAPNYTLVWDNYKEPTTADPNQHKVYIALEFKNQSGKDFWGMNNLIKNEATFYITAELDPDKITVTGKSAEDIAADKSLGVDWPVSYEMPPYYTSTEATTDHPAGTTKKIRRVFMQDYVTEANFVITDKSLKHALVAVPDLRTTQISLGLSVDLHWRQGLTFTVPVGGNSTTNPL